MGDRSQQWYLLEHSGVEWLSEGAVMIYTLAQGEKASTSGPS
jgi:hypothetical protein